MNAFFHKRHAVLLLLFGGFALLAGAIFFYGTPVKLSRLSASLGTPSATSYVLMPGETVNLRLRQPYIITCPMELPEDGTGPNPGLLFPVWNKAPWIDLFGTYEDNRTVTGSLLMYEFEQGIDWNTGDTVQNFIREKDMMRIGISRWPGNSYGFPESKTQFLDWLKPGTMYYVQADTGAYVFGQYGIGKEPGGDSIPFTCNSWTDGCFTAGTKITMADGSVKSIEHIRVGDMVLGWDEKTGEQKVSKVTETYVRQVPMTYMVHFRDRTLHVTGEHPVWVSGAWKYVRDVRIGDVLTRQDGSEDVVLSMEYDVQSTSVYNLTVDGVHTYYANGYLVHNKLHLCNGDGACGFAEDCGYCASDCGCPSGQECYVAPHTDAPFCRDIQSSSSSSSASSASASSSSSSASSGSSGSSGSNGSSGSSGSTGSATSQNFSIDIGPWTYSCPFIYAWDGSSFVRETEGIPFSPLASLKAGSHERLSALTPDADGTLRVKITEERDETSYIDHTILYAVDFNPVPGRSVVADVDGNIHTLETPDLPRTCQTSLGDDCKTQVSAIDRDVLTFDPKRLLEKKEDLTHDVVLTFDRPTNRKTAKLFLKVETASPSGNFSDTTLKKLGSTGLALFDSFFARTGNGSVIENALKDSAFYLAVDVQEGDTWRTVNFVRPGDYGGWDDFLVPIDFGATQESTVTVRLRTIWMYKIDFVGLDWSEDQPMHITTLVPTEKTTDSVRALLSAQDTKNLVLHKGDEAVLTYMDPARMRGKERQYVFSLYGHYIVDAPTLSAKETLRAVASLVQTLKGGTLSINAYVREFLMNGL